jgi:predicted transcriptional regulator of viral defense system
MGSTATFVTELAAQGRHVFTTREAQAALGGSTVTTQAALRRLKRRGAIAAPYRGFHVIVPPEYRRLECLPPEQFIDQLMRHLRLPYYVALLSAAELHGAAHQHPQSLQVMVSRNRRPLRCGRVQVEFVARKDMARTPTITTNTPRGTLRVASPEATALEVVGYPEHCGGLDNVATVLAELVEVLDRAKLVEAARLCPIAWVQRLGYLLDVIGREDVADALTDYVSANAVALAALVRARPTAGATRLARWKLALNDVVQPDL